jgi:hypothetical protein
MKIIYVCFVTGSSVLRSDNPVTTFVLSKEKNTGFRMLSQQLFFKKLTAAYQQN